MKIVSRFDGRTLYECDAETMAKALQAAVKAGANLAGAYLAGANLAGANLDRANLAGAKINWQSHDLLAEILWRAAGDDLQRRMLAGLPLVSRDWCWKQFLGLQIPAELRQWAIETLRSWLKDGDNAPEELRKVLAADHERDAA